MVGFSVFSSYGVVALLGPRMAHAARPGRASPRPPGVGPKVRGICRGVEAAVVLGSALKGALALVEGIDELILGTPIYE